MILHECYSVSILRTHSIHDRPPQSDASTFRVLVITHHRYISGFGPRAPVNQSAIGNKSTFGRQLHVSHLCLFYGTKNVRATH